MRRTFVVCFPRFFSADECWHFIFIALRIFSNNAGLHFPARVFSENENTACSECPIGNANLLDSHYVYFKLKERQWWWIMAYGDSRPPCANRCLDRSENWRLINWSVAAIFWVLHASIIFKIFILWNCKFFC